MKEKYLYSFRDTDIWFKSLYFINQHWLKIRFDLTTEQIAKLFSLISEISAKMDEIRGLMYVNPAGGDSNNQTKEPASGRPADSHQS